MPKIATVYDVAREAGVSRGTVDRVVFGRGRVSEATAQKVRQAIEQLHYVPNRNASCMGLRRELRVASLLPSFHSGQYWDLLFSGFNQALDQMREYNITFEPYFYELYDSDDYTRKAQQILDASWDIVITHAASKELLLKFSSSLAERGIPIALIDNKYDDMDYMIYSGVDNYKSGVLGARILTMYQDVRKVLLLRVKRKGGYDPNAPRRYGIIDYLTSTFGDISLENLFFDGSEGADNTALLDHYFAQHPDVKHIICPNSRVYLVSDWFGAHKDDGYILVGYDDLEQNMKALRDGSVSMLVTRQIPEQSRWLLCELVRCLMHNITPSVRNRYIHMDILTAWNIDFYR